MSDTDARQKAEDHYYAALDLMADGHLEKAVAAYQESLSCRSQLYRCHAWTGARSPGLAALR